MNSCIICRHIYTMNKQNAQQTIKTNIFTVGLLSDLKDISLGAQTHEAASKAESFSYMFPQSADLIRTT